MVKCSKCGAMIPDNGKFCPMCGTPKELQGTQGWEDTVIKKNNEDKEGSVAAETPNAQHTGPLHDGAPKSSELRPAMAPQGDRTYEGGRRSSGGIVQLFKPKTADDKMIMCAFILCMVSFFISLVYYYIYVLEPMIAVKIGLNPSYNTDGGAFSLLGTLFDPVLSTLLLVLTCYMLKSRDKHDITKILLLIWPALMIISSILSGIGSIKMVTQTLSELYGDPYSVPEFISVVTTIRNSIIKGIIYASILIFSLYKYLTKFAKPYFWLVILMAVYRIITNIVDIFSNLKELSSEVLVFSGTFISLFAPSIWCIMNFITIILIITYLGNTCSDD